MQKAIKLADSAVVSGNHPFGAILVHDNKIILEAENTVVTDNDITRHAELNLVSSASMKFDASILATSTLYTSTEPCAMCSGAIYWAGIQTLVFGCSHELLGAISGEALATSCQSILDTGTHKVVVIGPTMEDEAAVVHKSFWNNPK